MMEVVVNSQNHSIESRNITEILVELNIESRGVAIAVNGKVVPQVQWSEFKINQGDNIVVVSVVFGG